MTEKENKKAQDETEEIVKESGWKKVKRNSKEFAEKHPKAVKVVKIVGVGIGLGIGYLIGAAIKGSGDPDGTVFLPADDESADALPEGCTDLYPSDEPSEPAAVVEPAE